jgi:hypothetical protein
MICSSMSRTDNTEFLRTALGKKIICGFVWAEGESVWDGIPANNYWCVWMQSNADQTAGNYYKLYADGRKEHWHLYEDGTEIRLDQGETDPDAPELRSD